MNALEQLKNVQSAFDCVTIINKHGPALVELIEAAQEWKAAKADYNHNSCLSEIRIYRAEDATWEALRKLTEDSGNG